MILSGAFCSREAPSPATVVFRLISALLFSAFSVLPASAQYQTYRINTTVSSLPAGSYGATLLASTIDTSATANFKVCFDTGYGSSKVPIVPYNYVNTGRQPQFNFNVPASSIQAVPPSAFVDGSFAVSMYTVPPDFAACNGNEPGTAQGNTLTLNLPVLRSITLSNLPEQNADLKARRPSTLALTGTNFIGDSGTTGKVPSAVNFISTTTLTGTVKFISDTALVSTIPTTIPAAASSVTVEVCNTATYSYCSNSLTLKTVALQQNPGTLIASPNPALTTQPVTLTAKFGPSKHTVSGAPSGLVTFNDGGKTLGTSNLVLDRTATFAQAPTQQFLTYALPIAPIVADFNGDGIPDTLLIDPGTGNAGATLNLLLGTVPSGSFKANHPFDILDNGDSFVISSAAVGDFNGDGIPDLVLLAQENIPGAVSPLTLYTLLGKGDGTFQNGFSSSPTLYGSQIVAGDFNKDGKQDIVIAGALDIESQYVGLLTLLGNGKGSFVAGPSTRGLRTAPSPYFGDYKVAAADFNDDGYPDIAVMNGYSPQGQLDNSIELYQNSGKGTFDAPVSVQTDGTATNDFSIARLGPGKPLDILITSTANPGIYVGLNQSTTARIAFFETLEATPVPGLVQAVVGDFDGDGLLDVAVEDQKTIHVLSGVGDAFFTAKYPSLSLPLPTNATLVAASDENGDTYADLLLYTAGAQDGNTRYPITLYDYITAGTATATLPAATYTPGTHALQAATNGTFNILAGTATATLNISLIAPSLTLTSFPDSPQTYGGIPTSLIGSIFDDSQNPSAGSTATGTASFYNGKTLVGTAPLVRTVGAGGSSNDAATLALVDLPVGTYSFSVQYPGDAGHAATTSGVLPFRVVAATPSISWKPTPTTFTYGTPLSSAQLNAVATGVAGENIPGTFIYAPALGTVLAVGTHLVVVTFNPTDPNYASTTANHNLVVTQASPVLTWKPNPATIPYGTALSAAQLDATSSTPGTFVYTPAAETLLDAGTHILSTTFTPADKVNFASETWTATINVTQTTSVTTLTITSAGAVATSIPTGTAATLTATVAMAGQPVTPGQVAFCDANYPHCTDIHLLGTAQLTSTGTATVRLVPGIGSHSYKAIFLGTDDTATSTSTTLPITVTGAYPTSTTIAQSGFPGSYILTAETTGISPALVAPPTGDISFLDTSNGNAVLGTKAFGSSTPGLDLVNSATEAAGTDPDSVVTADFNGDGKPDFAVASAGHLFVFLGKGDGTFTAVPVGTALSSNDPFIASGDFNGDGKADLVVTNAANTLTVLLGKGNGTFTPTASPSTGDNPSFIAVADLNRDGIADLVVVANDSTAGAGQKLTVLLGVGDGTFKAAASPVFGALVATPTSVAVGDFNEDGKVDLAVTNCCATGSGYTSGVSLLLGNGDGSFQTPKIIPQSDQLTQAYVVAGDLNGDGHVDLATLSADSNIVVFLGNGAGTFSAGIPSFASGGAGTGLVIGDFNGDGKPDLATSSTFEQAVSVMIGNGKGGFTPAGLPATGQYPLPPASADFNGDGVSDLVIPNQIGSASVLLGVPTHTATAVLSNVSPIGVGDHLIKAAYAGDTKYKASTSSSTSLVGLATEPAITWKPNPATIVYGTPLSAAQLNATSPTPGTFVYTPAAGTVLAAGTHTLSTTFTPKNTTDFTITTTTVAIVVTAATPTVTWTPLPATIPYGSPLSSAQLDATSPTPGTFTFTPAAGTVLAAGTHTLSTTFTPKDTTDFTLVTKTVSLIVTSVAPTVTWVPNPSSITSGTALSAAQLDATANTPGTFAYNPALATVLAVGTQTLNVVFTPTDRLDFTTASKTASISVVTAALTVSPTTLVFGDQPYNTTSSVKTVTVSNPGTEAVSISGVEADAGTNPEDFLPTSNCPASLLPGATCQISVAFLPDGVGPKSGVIDIDTSVAFPPITASGTGTGGILQVNPGNLKTIAGNGTQGYTGEGTPATAAELNNPDGLAFDSLGNLYIADTNNSVVRKVDTSGKITTIAGTGTPGYSGDNGFATNAELDRPYGVTFDHAGNLYIQDTKNSIIRKVDTTGIITTFAGTPDTEGHTGDGLLATKATLADNQGARFDTAGNLFVPNCQQPSIRKIDTKGIITTVAGNFTGGYTGDGKPATSAQLSCPSGVAFDVVGNFYIADYSNNAIRKVDTKGIITTIAGNGTAGATGDGGQASAATLNLPNDVVFDATGNLFIADSGNNRIRRIDTKGIITTVAGGLGSAGSAIVNSPFALTLDSNGNLYFSDTGNNAVREFVPQSLNAFPATAIGTTAAPQTVTLSNVGNVPIVIPSRASFVLSGDAADFSLTGGTCLAGATLASTQSTCTLQISFTPTAVGARTLTVAIADNALNSPQNFTIGGNGTSILPTLKWTPPASIVYGTPLSATQLNAVSTGLAGATVAGSFAYTPAAGTVLAAGTHTLSVLFTPAGTTYLPLTATVPIIVTQALPTISWKPTPATIAYGTPLSAAQLDAASTIPGSFVYTPSLGTVLNSGTQTLTAVFTPTDALNFQPVTTTTSILVTDINPVVTWKPNPATIPYGTPLSVAQLNATSAIPGTFLYTPALGTVLGAGPHILSVLFNPTDTVNYKPLTSTVDITVTQLAPTVTWIPNPSNIPYGTPLSNAQLDATSATPGTFVYTPALGSALAAGTHTLTAVFTPRDSTDFRTITSTATILVTAVSPTISWTPNPATIAYGTALSAAQLDATSATPGTFAYTPAIGTILDAGPHLLAVTFTPTDTTDFSSVTKTVPITVDPAAPTVTWNPDPATIPYGTALSAAQLDATSPLAGAFTYGPANGAILTAGVQTLTLRFHPTDTNYGIVNLTRTITVTQAAPLLTWATPASINLGTALSATQLDAIASGVGGLTLPGSFTYTPALGTILPTGTHTLSVLFTPTDAIDYTSATATVLQTVAVPETVTQLAATINSSEYGQPVTFTAATLAGTQTATGTTNFFDGTNQIGSSTTSPATLTLSTLTAGTHNIVATFVANDSFAGSSSAAVVQKVSPAATTITWLPSPATISFNTPIFVTQLDATVATTYIKSVPGVFTYAPTLGTILNAGPQTLRVTFTPTDTVDFLASSATALLTVDPIDPIVAWAPNPATISYGTPLSASQLDATSTIPGTYTYTPGAASLLTAGVQTITLRFQPTSSNYNPVTLTRTVTVAASNAIVTWLPNPATISYGAPLSASQLDATSNTPGTFTYTPALGAVLGAGTQTLSVLFAPTDTVNFKSFTSTTTIVVAQATPAVTWLPNPSTIPFGTALSTTQLDATSSTPGTFVYTPALGTVLGAGTQSLSALFTPTDSVNFRPVTTTASVTITKAKPSLLWTTPAGIAFGTPLSATQLDASATGINGVALPGTFTYTPAAGTVLPAGTSTVSVLFTPTDIADYTTATTSVLVTVAGNTPVITWVPAAATIPYGTGLTPAQLDATSSTPGTFTYTPAAGTVLTAGTQTLSVLFTPTDTVRFKSVTATAIITVAQATPAISWQPNPATISYGTTLSTAQLDATSATPGTFVYTPTLGTVVAAGTQTLTAIFTPRDLTDFKSVTATVTILVSAVTPTVNWTPNPAIIAYGTALTAAQLNATSTTAGTFAYTPGLGTVLNAGIQTLTAVFTPSNATNFKPLTTNTTILVTPAIPAVTWNPNPATIAYGAPLSAAQLDATSTVPGTFVYTPSLGTVLTAGTQSLSVVFTPADAVNYKPVTATAILAVTSVTPSVIWIPTVATIAYGTPLSVAQLDATSTTPGSFSYTPALGTVLSVGTQTLTTVFTPKDTTNYKSITSTITIVITAATPTIAWTPSPATIAYGTALTAAQLNATSTTPGTFTYTPALGTVLSVGTQPLSALFTPTDATDFESVTTSVTITVTASTPTITWAPSPATITYGTALTAAQLNATSTTPGTFVYTPALGTVLSAGTQTISSTFTPADAKDFKSLTTTVAITVTASTPTITWAPSPATITYGTPLSAAQLDATSNTPGSFVYTPTLGTIPTVGTQTISVVFTPTDAKDFKSLTTTATITVIAATPAVTWLPNPATITYGTALSAAQLDATATTPGTFVYTPAFGTVLSAGPQVLSAVFTPADAKDYKALATTTTITVQQAVPTIVWPTPASIVVGSALSSAQLNATATGVSGVALPGTFTYTPVAGTLLPVGTQTVKVLFTPTDLADYTTVTASIPLQVIPVTLASLSSTQAALGDPAKTITLTGTGFVPTAVVQVNGTAIPTTFVNATTLTATIPAADFLVAQVLQINVVETSQNQTTAPLTFLVGAPLASAVFAGPSTIQPGTDTDLSFKLTNPYPVDLTANFGVSFTPAAGLPNDPGVLFTNGKTTYSVTVPANSTASPPVSIQGSTVAGSMTLTLMLEAGGVDVTPPSIQPLIIQAPLAIPGVSSASVTRAGNTLTVVVRGLSNPRDMTSAKFHFTPVTGGSIGTEDVTIDVVPIFTTWYADPASLQYGSTFTYTQSFDLSSDASVVGQVSVTLFNSVGESQEADTP